MTNWVKTAAYKDTVQVWYGRIGLLANGVKQLVALGPRSTLRSPQVVPHFSLSSLSSFSTPEIALLLIRSFQMNLLWIRSTTRGCTVARARVEATSRKGINWATRSGLLQNLFSTAMFAQGQKTTAGKCFVVFLYFVAFTFPFLFAPYSRGFPNRTQK